jgi:glycosyltransferase involved in cell wall biosynthesis
VTRRLAFFVPSFRGGGAERVVVTLAQAFAAEGFATDILVAQLEGPNRPPAMPGMRVVDLGSSRVLASLAPLVRYLRKERPDGMLSALPHANVVAVCARSLAGGSTRLVVSEHTVASLSAAHSTRMRGRMLPRFMRHAYPRADAIVAVSDGVAADLAALTGIARTRIQRIYNPVVSEGLSELAATRLDHPWFEAGQPPVVLGAGRLTAAKDFGCLIRAFAGVRARRPVRLMLLGEGEERARLEEVARESGVADDIALPGFVENPYPYMKRASVFALSSRWEGFGNVLVEAMACGTPVVSTDCGGPREILEQGAHGTLVPVGDVAALARAIEAQLDGPRNPAAVSRAQAFTVEAALARYRAALGI